MVFRCYFAYGNKHKKQSGTIETLTAICKTTGLKWSEPIYNLGALLQSLFGYSVNVK